MRGEMNTELTSIYLSAFVLIFLITSSAIVPAVSAAKYEIQQYSLVRSVVDGRPGIEPATTGGAKINAVFLSVDEYVYSYIKFKQVTGPFILKTEWYSPKGELYATSFVNQTRSSTFSDWWAWFRIRLAGAVGEELYGVWSVKTYLDDELIASARFLVLSPSLIWRYLELYEETKNTNIALEKTLNEYKQKLEETNREIATLGSRNKELTDALAEARTKHDTLSQEYSKAVSEKHSLQNEVATLKEKLLSTENELNSISMQRLLALLAAGILAVVTVVSLARRKKPSYIPPPPSPTDVKGSLPSSQTKA